jgi:hypothetical protein
VNCRGAHAGHNAGRRGEAATKHIEPCAHTRRQRRSRGRARIRLIKPLSLSAVHCSCRPWGGPSMCATRTAASRNRPQRALVGAKGISRQQSGRAFDRRASGQKLRRLVPGRPGHITGHQPAYRYQSGDNRIGNSRKHSLNTDQLVFPSLGKSPPPRLNGRSAQRCEPHPPRVHRTVHPRRLAEKVAWTSLYIPLQAYALWSIPREWSLCSKSLRSRTAARY